MTTSLDNDAPYDKNCMKENNNHDPSSTEGEGYVVYVGKEPGTATIALVNKTGKPGTSPEFYRETGEGPRFRSSHGGRPMQQ